MLNLKLLNDDDVHKCYCGTAELLIIYIKIYICIFSFHILILFKVLVNVLCIVICICHNFLFI